MPSNAAELLQKSDMAMYAKKRDGKNGAQIFDNSMLDSARGRAEIESHIETGLVEDWFEAYLQPIVDLNDRGIAGFEALMRLNHPQKGLMPPAEIISVAEETGKIVRVGNVIMEKAIAHLAKISRIARHAGYLSRDQLLAAAVRTRPARPPRRARRRATASVRIASSSRSPKPC